MTTLAKDDNLGVGCWVLGVGYFILALDAFLQLEHHRTGGIDDLDIVPACQFVGLRGFSVSPQQHFHIVQLLHFVVLDGHEAHLTKTVTLHAIVHDITQAIEFIAMRQFLFGLLNSGGHTEAEATAIIDFDYHNYYMKLKGS